MAHGAGAAHGEHGEHRALPAGDRAAGQSVYQLDSRWQNQRGEDVPLGLYRGHPTVVLMFYGTCRAVCPLLIGDMKRIEDALPTAVRAQTRFLLVTFDPDTDTPARLLDLARERALDPARWTLLHGSADAVRELATVLGVQYRAVGDGQYAHSNLITLLDGEGVVAYQLEGVRQPVDAMVQHINAATEHPAS
jgi:protein SCO1/2